MTTNMIDQTDPRQWDPKLDAVMRRPQTTRCCWRMTGYACLR
jgi:hypothetical protein